MLNNWRHYLGLAILIALAVAGLNYRWQPPAAPNSALPESSAQLPDMVLQQPLLESFDDTGKRSRQLQGQVLEFFDTTDQSYMVLPILHFQQSGHGAKQDTLWQVRAENAVLYQKSDQVDLHGNVVLWSDNTRDGRTEIRSETLHVDTRRQFAETDKAVTIRARRSEVRSIGLQADLTNERLLLPSRVKEIHEVTQRP